MTSKTIINFSPGPAKIPKEVLLKAQKELLDYGGITGISVLEMSHRSPAFESIIKKAEKLIIDLMSVPPNYRVLFMQGGGVGQFAAVPLNLLGNGQVADYVVTGSWSKKAAAEAARYGTVNHVLPKIQEYITIPNQNTWKVTSNAAYLYYCANETIEGVEFDYIPETGDVPIVCDMSSCIMSCNVDVSKFGIIFAGAQKNLGCAGITIVIIRDDLMGKAVSTCPSILNYQTIADNSSLYNTPCCYSIYITKLVLEWVIDQGELEGITQLNKRKAESLYGAIENSGAFYTTKVDPRYRSRMNVVFRINTKNGTELEAQFIKEAKDQGMIELKGHRSVGGLRISLYNGVNQDDVNTLIAFMKSFQNKNINK